MVPGCRIMKVYLSRPNSYIRQRMGYHRWKDLITSFLLAKILIIPQPEQPKQSVSHSLVQASDRLDSHSELRFKQPVNEWSDLKVLRTNLYSSWQRFIQKSLGGKVEWYNHNEWVRRFPSSDIAFGTLAWRWWWWRKSFFQYRRRNDIDLHLRHKRYFISFN